MTTARSGLMDRFLAVLEKDSELQPSAQSSTQLSRVPAHSRAVVELMAQMFPDVNPPRIVAFAGIAHGAGVTTTLRALSSAIEHETGRSPAIVNAAEISSWKRALRTPGGPSADGPAGVTALFARLLGESDCVFIDCQPIETSADLSRVAALADGVVLVVEAGVTRKTQIERAVASIKAAKGVCLGVVLNKRRYPIPNWLYRFIG